MPTTAPINLRSTGPTVSRIARRAVGEVIDAAADLRKECEASSEQVHALRRACRGASVTLDLLRDGLEKQAMNRLQKILRKIRRRAGRVRDLDVHAELAAELMGAEGKPRSLHREIEEERPDREKALREFVESVTEDRLRRLRSKLAPDREADVATIREAVARRARRWTRRAKAVLARPLPEESALHDLRIDLKKLRIALRMLHDLGVRGVQRKEEIIAASARHLGRFHDIATLRERVESRTDSRLPEIAELVRRLRAEEGDSVVLARNSLRRLRSA